MPQACSATQFILVRGRCKRWSSHFGVFIYWDAYPRVAVCMYCIDMEKGRLGKLQKTFAVTVGKFSTSRCYDIYLKEESTAREKEEAAHHFTFSFCELEWDELRIRPRVFLVFPKYLGMVIWDATKNKPKQLLSS